ncbi:MAG: HDOD domain-containing protein [Armatimonadota bacterium]|nr:HDOD domain-containing protein [bacterium]
MFHRSSDRIDLPSLPEALRRIIDITKCNEVDAESLAHVVMIDQSLACKVLRLANSAYFARRDKAETVTDAIITLGSGYVRNLAASASVLDALFPSNAFPGFHWHHFWKHSVTTAIAAESFYAFATGCRKKNEESAFVAGLMHDVGKLVIARALPFKFRQVVETCRERRLEMLSIETELLGTNHIYIGKQLARSWQFPDKLLTGIAYHHAPENAREHQDLAAAVCAADMLAKRIEDSYLVGMHPNISLGDIAKTAGLDAQGVNFVIDEVRIGLKRCGEILSWGKDMPYDMSRAA